jgi:hypothetical protein
MQSKATTVKEYLAELPADRGAEIEQVRAYPPGYHCDPWQPLPFACLAAQKNYLSVYLGCIYGDHALAKWFRAAWAKPGKKLDAGKTCIRFKRADDLALDVIGEAIQRMPARKFIAYYESVLKSTRSRKAGKGKSKR